jgi:hypothetical protein
MWRAVRRREEAGARVVANPLGSELARKSSEPQGQAAMADAAKPAKAHRAPKAGRGAKNKKDAKTKKKGGGEKQKGNNRKVRRRVV